MNTFIETTGRFFGWILQSTWQAAVLVVLILAVQWIFRNRLSPSWKYGLWLLLVVRLLMPVSPQSAVSIFNLAHVDSDAGGVEEATAPISEPVAGAVQEPRNDVAQQAQPAIRAEPWEAISGRSEPVPPAESQIHPSQPAMVAPPADRQFNGFRAGALVWLCGVFVLGVRFMVSNMRFRKRLRNDMTPAVSEVMQLVNECREQIGVSDSVHALETNCVETPAVWGFWRKCLLLPRGIAGRFDRFELKHILLHELAHVKRRDVEVTWVVSMLQVLHWFNPLLWFAFRRMRADRELATDALAMGRSDEADKALYGETILKVLESIRGPAARPGLVGIVEDKSRMKERMLHIVRFGKAKYWRWLPLGLCAGLAVTALTDAAVSGSDESEEETVLSGKQFVLRAVDYESGAPIAGAKVRFDFEYYTKPATNESRVTGADGKAVVSIPREDVKRFAYQVEKAGYLAPQGEWLRNQVGLVPATFEVKLSQGVEIGGTVTDAAGAPVSGAEVIFNYPARKHIAITGANGRWSARCIYPGIRWAALRVRHPDFCDVVYSTEVTKAMEAEGKDHTLDFSDLESGRATFVMSPGVDVTGKVIDENGAPVRGAVVRYGDKDAGHPSSAERTTAV